MPRLVPTPALPRHGRHSGKIEVSKHVSPGTQTRTSTFLGMKEPAVKIYPASQNIKQIETFQKCKVINKFYLMSVVLYYILRKERRLLKFRLIQSCI